jgi:hypothetical protein
LIEEIAEANWPDASVLFHELQFLRWPYSFWNMTKLWLNLIFWRDVSC